MVMSLGTCILVILTELFQDENSALLRETLSNVVQSHEELYCGDTEEVSFQ